MHRILILDDDEAASSALEEAIEQLGHAARRSTFGPAVWSAIRNWLPDLLFLDGDPDGTPGCDLLGRIRQDAFFASLPVIVSAGVTRRDLVERFLHLRVQGIMVKPCSADRVRREIERAGRTSFRASFFAPIEDIASRTGHDPSELAKNYRQVAAEIEHALGDLAVLVGEPFNPHALTKLFGLKGCGLQVGCQPLTRMVEDAFRGYNRLDSRPIRRAVQDLPVFVRLLLRQAGEIDAFAGLADPSTFEEPAAGATASSGEMYGVAHPPAPSEPGAVSPAAGPAVHAQTPAASHP
jgi:CheY-like chemotaxis protein